MLFYDFVCAAYGQTFSYQSIHYSCIVLGGIISMTLVPCFLLSTFLLPYFPHLSPLYQEVALCQQLPTEADSMASAPPSAGGSQNNNNNMPTSGSDPFLNR